MTKIKNKMYQPLPLMLDGRTVMVPQRKSIEVTKITQQMIALKAKGLLQIIKN